MEELAFLQDIESDKCVSISEEQFKSLNNSGEVIFEEDTLISHCIRLFKMYDFYIFQEKSPKGEILIRKFKYKDKAELLIKQRLGIYEKMWNGCGCRIDYYNNN